MSDAGASSPNQLAIFIRGIGVSDQNAMIDPAIGLYIDGAYISRSQAGVLDLLDLDHIEVLRGPQGTLFGANTSGGVVNLITRTPNPNGGGQVSLTVGNLGQLEGAARADIPIANNLTLGISLMGKHRNCLANRASDHACYGDVERETSRARLHWTPTSNLTVDLVGDALVDRSHALPMKLVGIDPNASIFGAYNGICASGGIPGCRPYTATVPSGPYAVQPAGMTTDTPANNVGVSLQIAWKVGDVTLHSITSYRKVNAISATDVAGDPGVMDGYSPVGVWENAGSQLGTQELRADGALFGNRLHYIVGGYLSHESAFQRTAGTVLPPTESGFLNVNQQIAKSEALFAHLNFDVTSRLHVVAGVRKSWTAKEWKYKYANYSDILNDTGVDPTMQTAQLIYTPDYNIPNALLGNSTNFVNNRASWSPVTPMGGINFQMTPNVFLFADVSRGYRSGGFNPRATTIEATAPYAPEYTTSYEIGEKAELFNHR